MKQALLKLLLLFTYSSALSQVFSPKNYPQHYFRDPLNIPISLAGNFGELRPNHYHMGLDIRTEKRENLPVYAAADGYIAKVKIEPAGFGQAIYIVHPNGYTTLYAHLNSFYPALAGYIKQQQYNHQSWRVQVDLPPNLFTVKKGELIAYSGSTGGSQAPHLHFEIRRTLDDVNLNPMLFGFAIPDNTSPAILRLAIYDGQQSIYEQSPRILPVKRNGSQFTAGAGVIMVNSPKIRFAISAFDTQSGTTNQNGIYQAILYEDGQSVIGFQMDGISYDNTRSVNAHIDYRTKANGGPYLQQLFQLPGYKNSIYKIIKNDGVIDLSDGAVHSFRIEVKDAFNNVSELHYQVRWQSTTIYDVIFAGKEFYPEMLDGFESEDCAFYIGEKCLYDSVHIAYSKMNLPSPEVYSAVHGIGATHIPLQDSFLVRIKPNIPVTELKKNKIIMERAAGGKTEVQRVQWHGGWASARFREFGNFRLVLDEVPPVIIPVGIKEGANLARSVKIAFIIKDNMDSYKNFSGELDGKWLLFSNDKGKSYVYKFDEHCPPGKHVLKVSVEDEAGNQAVKEITFTR